MSPLAYIVAPFVLALALFVLYLLVSLVMGDPARPFRMFASKPIDHDAAADGPAEEEAPADARPGGAAGGPRQESK